MSSLKELARKKVDELVRNWEQGMRLHGVGNYTERDAITNFILPLIEALGWNIFNVAEVKQEGYPKDFIRPIPVENRSLDKPDCILSFNGKPYIVFEFKRLRYVEIENLCRVETLLAKAEYLDTKYAVLSNFYQAIVYDWQNEKTLIKFNHPEEYLSKFEELYRYLSKDGANTILTE